MTKIVVVGAVAGGATVASQIRRLDQDSEIVVFEKDRDMSFANCALPYYIGNVVNSRDHVLEATPEQFYSKKHITVKTYHEVTAIDDANSKVIVYDKKAEQSYTVDYDKLILSPGCSANNLNLNSPISFTLRNMEDTDAIYQFIEQNHVQKALVIGAGYISLEVVDNLYERNIDTTLIHRSEHINKLMDADMNQPILDEMDKRNITYHLNESVTKVIGNEVYFKSGRIEQFDLIIEGVGVKPNSSFMKSSQLNLDEHGYIPVNDKFETNIPNIYALGDIITSHYRHVDLPAHVPLAWGAHRGASIIAEQIAGNPNIRFKGYLGSNIVKFFDYTFASVGVSPKELEHFDYKSVELNQYDHAGYYPNKNKIHLRVYFDVSNRRIIRAAAVGKSGVDKRIDILSMAMMHHSTIDDLTDFEVAYAPPYSRPKDIINMIGYKARNL
ncbi:CoA-disulfide reductase [Staphylococcus sp. ACRSN]|uniref:CoA-disulfide reductase n=1 Tax=Staphylococcus sp. ACRSN TaxID=2918214 RepID=UPI001EF2F6C8|nr:CoA-disulfide reductase [Staphylococcus sp. ACRSN]